MGNITPAKHQQISLSLSLWACYHADISRITPEHQCVCCRTAASMAVDSWSSWNKNAAKQDMILINNKFIIIILTAFLVNIILCGVIWFLNDSELGRAGSRVLLITLSFL